MSKERIIIRETIPRAGKATAEEPPLSLLLQCREVELKLEGWLHDWADVNNRAIGLTKRWKDIKQDTAAVESRLAQIGEEVK